MPAESVSSSNGHHSISTKIKRILFGAPKDPEDSRIFKHLSLIPILAWVGLGADGLSSSAYGPEEAFRTLGEHAYLAVGLALVTAITVTIISLAYSHIIEEFPQGGGGYLVAGKLLGERWGVVSGSALLVDYVLTVTVSVAAAGDAIFSMIPGHAESFKFGFEIFLIIGLTILNIRGVKESVMTLAPIFFLFLLTHAALIFGGIAGHVGRVPEVAAQVSGGFSAGLSSLGAGGMFLLFVHAYSLGGGTYTGIEAVSNGLPIMREPRVQTAKRTMLYMASSLALTAGGLLLCYLLFGVRPVAGKTMNAVLLETFAGGSVWGQAFVIASLFSEGALLIVAAQAGFIDGPRVLANMAVDNWVPRPLASLSERLTVRNGITLIGAGSLLALLYTHGDVGRLVVMYSINVFLTFSLSMLGMTLHTLRERKAHPGGKKGALGIFLLGLAMCATILVITVLEKFEEGGWMTVAVTTGVVCLCMLVKRHYRTVGRKSWEMYKALIEFTPPESDKPAPELDPSGPTAVILVGGYTGLGLHILFTVLRLFPKLYRNVIFMSVGVIDSGTFKGVDTVRELKDNTESALSRYRDMCTRMGLAADFRFAIGTDVVEEAEKLAQGISREFPLATFFAGKLVFSKDKWYQRLLHNETAHSLQRRLQMDGIPLVILPARVE